MNDDNFEALCLGKLSAASAMTSGKLKITGNMKKA